MNYFKSEKVTDHITRIITPAEVLCYLIEGDKSAVLVDTACGLGDLKGYVDSLTKKPYVVILTHGHLDHAGGAEQFPEVYINKKDLTLAVEQNKIADRQGYLEMNIGPVNGEEMHAPKADGYHFMEDGDVFDLGGIHVIVYAFPGHTPGSMVVMIKEDRSVILGDACNSNTFLQMPDSPVLSEYAKTAQAFKDAHLSEIDTVLFSHGHNHGTPIIFEQAVEVCNAIAAGRPGIPVEGPMIDGCLSSLEIDFQTMMRKDGGIFNCIYKAEQAK